MTFETQVRALKPLGLSRRCLEFLVVVALHGGYCLQRQYDAFVDRAHGRVGWKFFTRLVSSQLATRVQFAWHRGYVYHLRAKSLYRAIGQRDTRHRRSATPALIARRLMILDYLLAHEPAAWLATAADKVALFTETLGVAKVYLPQRRCGSLGEHREETTLYFPQRLPIGPANDCSCVQFVYLAVDESGAGFRTFLAAHTPLLCRLPSWTVAVVCPRYIDGFAACQHVFARSFRWQTRNEVHLASEDLRWYFQARDVVDRGDLTRLSITDLDRFRELRHRWSTAPVEQLFAAWQQFGDAALVTDATGRVLPPPIRGRLVEHVLPFAYDQFGSLPGIV